MKTKIFTICIMVAALAMFAPVANADFKVTGGGWIILYDEWGVDYSRPTFGFQMKCKSDNNKISNDCVGNLQYNDRDEDIKIHSTEVDTGWVADGLWHFSGSCRFQTKYEYGEFEYENGAFDLIAGEEGFGIAIYDENHEIMLYSPGEYPNDVIDLGRGNINIQVK